MVNESSSVRRRSVVGPRAHDRGAIADVSALGSRAGAGGLACARCCGSRLRRLPFGRGCRWLAGQVLWVAGCGVCGSRAGAGGLACARCCGSRLRRLPFGRGCRWLAGQVLWVVGCGVCGSRAGAGGLACARCCGSRLRRLPFGRGCRRLAGQVLWVAGPRCLRLACGGRRLAGQVLGVARLRCLPLACGCSPLPGQVLRSLTDGARGSRAQVPAVGLRTVSAVGSDMTTRPLVRCVCGSLGSGAWGSITQAA